MLGTVVKSTGSWYLVETEEKERVECKIKGNFRLKGIRSTNPIAVGDRVEFEKNEDGIGLINRIYDRKIILFVARPIYPKNSASWPQISI